MLTASQVTSNFLVQLNRATDRTFALPIVAFYPTARCNSRCVSCDWWKADGASDLTMPEIRALVDELPALRTRLVSFSGGEPTLRRDVYEIAELFRARVPVLHLLTSGLFLERDAARVAENFRDVTISLDAVTPAGYERIRGVNALPLVERGVRALKRLAPTIRVRARSTLHRLNYAELPQLIDKAHAMGLDGISFLAADVTSEAFGRAAINGNGDPAARRSLLLERDQIAELAKIIEHTLRSHEADFRSGFVAEPPAKLRRLPAYYAAHRGQGSFPLVDCDAPWASAVIEADGSVRPCYFHPPVGNIRQSSLRTILGRQMVAFRRSLDVARDDTCRRCVCTLQVGWRSRT